MLRMHIPAQTSGTGRCGLPWVLAERTLLRWINRCCVEGRLRVPRLAQALLIGRDWAAVWVAAQQVR